MHQRKSCNYQKKPGESEKSPRDIFGKIKKKYFKEIIRNIYNLRMRKPKHLILVCHILVVIAEFFRKRWKF